MLLCQSILGDTDLHRSDAVDDVLSISPLIAALDLYSFSVSKFFFVGSVS